MTASKMHADTGLNRAGKGTLHWNLTLIHNVQMGSFVSRRNRQLIANRLNRSEQLAKDVSADKWQTDTAVYPATWIWITASHTVYWGTHSCCWLRPNNEKHFHYIRVWTTVCGVLSKKLPFRRAVQEWVIKKTRWTHSKCYIFSRFSELWGDLTAQPHGVDKTPESHRARPRNTHSISRKTTASCLWQQTR